MTNTEATAIGMTTDRTERTMENARRHLGDAHAITFRQLALGGYHIERKGKPGPLKYATLEFATTCALIGNVCRDCAALADELNVEAIRL